MTTPTLRELALECADHIRFDGDMGVEKIEALLVRVRIEAIEEAACEVIDCNAIAADTRRIMAARIRELANPSHTVSISGHTCIVFGPCDCLTKALAKR